MKKFIMIVLTGLLFLAVALLGATNVQGLLVTGGGTISADITESRGKVAEPFTLIFIGSGLIGYSLITRIKSKKQVHNN